MNQSATGGGRLARWSLWLGLAAVALPIVGALGARIGLWHFGIGLLLAPGSLIPAILGLILGLIALARQRESSGSRATAAIGAAISLLAAGYLGLSLQSAFSHPQMLDVSTDIADPPRFVAAHQLRAEGDNPLNYDSEVIGPVQREGYPDIAPLVMPLPRDEMYDRAREALVALGLEIVREDREGGRIEAVATTFWFGFKDDVVLRLREVETGTRLDLRSASRVGVSSDLGANARRIREIISRVEAAARG